MKNVDKTSGRLIACLEASEQARKRLDEELRRCSGTQFDPELVEVFSRAMNEVMKRDQGVVVQSV